MKQFLAILFVLALPAFSSAGEFVVVPDADSNLNSGPTPRSFLGSDIFIRQAHTCQTGNIPCGPDNVVSGSFSGFVRFTVPTTQSYQFLFVLFDTEGAVVGSTSATFPFTAGATGSVNSSGFSVPGSSSVATNGLYKLMAIIIGANGQATFSPYYGPVRVTP